MYVAGSECFVADSSYAPANEKTLLQKLKNM